MPTYMKRDSAAAAMTPPGALPVHDEAALRQLAAQAIASGELPADGAARIWGGPGVGLSCTICRTPVMHDESEIELEFDGRDGRLRTCHLHLRCSAAWEAVRHPGVTHVAAPRRAVLMAIPGDGKIRAREQAPSQCTGKDDG